LEHVTKSIQTFADTKQFGNIFETN